MPAESWPTPGHVWYVVVKVPGLGRRLRYWKLIEYRFAEKRTPADWEAFIAWRNLGVEAGWDTFSEMDDTDLSLFFGESANVTPAFVYARLKRTPALSRWLKEVPSGSEAASSRSTDEHRQAHSGA